MLRSALRLQKFGCIIPGYNLSLGRGASMTAGPPLTGSPGALIARLEQGIVVPVAQWHGELSSAGPAISEKKNEREEPSNRSIPVSVKLALRNRHPRALSKAFVSGRLRIWQERSLISEIVGLTLKFFVARRRYGKRRAGALGPASSAAVGAITTQGGDHRDPSLVRPHKCR